MTAPRFDYFGELRKQQGELDAAVAGSEWSSFLAKREQLLQEMLAGLHQTGQQLLPQPPQPQLDPTQQGQPQTPPPTPDQRESLINRAHFWKIPNPESMNPQDLEAAIQAKRGGVAEAAHPTTETRALLLGAGAEAFAESATRMLGNLMGGFKDMEDVPFVGQALTKILHVDRAQRWLKQVADGLQESQAYIAASQPAEDRTEAQFVTGAGKMAGYLLPAVAAWEGLGALGAGFPVPPWLARFATPLTRLAVRGAATSFVLDDPNSSPGEKALNIGIGAVLGGSQMYGKYGVAGGLGFLGAGVGAQIGDTPQDRQRHSIEGAIAGVTLPLLGPVMAQAFSKVSRAFPTTPGRGVSIFEGIPVDQSGRPIPNAETVVEPEFVKQESGNPVPEHLKQQAGVQGPEDLAALFRGEPTRSLGPGGQVQEGLPGASTAGLLPTTTTVPPAAETQYNVESLARLLGGRPEGDVAYYPSALVDQARRAGDRAVFEAQRYAPQEAPTPQIAGLLPASTEVRYPYLQQHENIAYSTPEREQQGLDLATFLSQRNAPLSAKGLASVSRGPSHLLGSKVAAADGSPLRVYHGTSLDYEEMDLSKADPEALYDGGLYHTESVDIAGGVVRDTGTEVVPTEPGYSQLTAFGQTGYQPNIRPAFLDIKNPFDIDAKYSVQEALAITDKLEQANPGYQWGELRKAIQDENVYDPATGVERGPGPLTGEMLYQTMANTPLTDAPQAPGDVSFLPRTLEKAGLNQALQSIGYDGITHIGGAITGNEPHRVWIALSPSQVHAPYNVERLAPQQAAAAAQNITKQATVIESSELPVTAAKAEVTEADAVQALKVANPGGTSVLRGVGKPLDVLADHPDIHYVERNGQLDALVGEFTPDMVQDYQHWGMYSGQTVVTAKGIEGEILQINGRGMAIVTRKAGGPPLRVKVENLLPSRFGDPHRVAPEIWNSYKADLLRYMNEEADAAGMAPVRDIWDPRVGEVMQQHLEDFLNRRGINDPVDRQVIDAYVNQQFVNEAKTLDPESQELQARMVDDWTVAANEAEVDPEAAPVSLEEKAQAKGFVWLTDPGTGGGRLRDNLNPESGFEVPVESDAAAEEFLHNVDRTPPDLTPSSSVPFEVMDAAPTEGVEPRATVEQAAQMLGDAVEDADYEITFDPHFGGGGAEPPTGAPPGAGGFDEGPPRIAGTGETVGDQFARLRRDHFARYMELGRKYQDNTFRYTRYFMASMEKTFEKLGLSLARPWRDYESLETARVQADAHAAPWLKEYGEILGQFDRRIVRDGSVTRIHEIEDPNARYAAWYRLKETHGFNDARIKQFIAADDRITDFNHRWFEFLTEDPAFALTADREIFRYMSHVRARQAAGAADPFNSEGWLSPNSQYFAEFARDGNVQFRIMDAKELGSMMIRGGMFKKYQAGPWEEFVGNWQDQRIPEPIRKLMLDHARSMRYGYDPSGDLAVRGVQFLTDKMLGVKMSGREAAHVVAGPVHAMYMSMLGGRASIFFRDAIQPLLALAKVQTPYMAGVYRDVIAGAVNRDALAAMYKRGLEGGWILHEAPAMEGLGMFEEQPGLRPNELLELTPKEAARRETLARLGDVAQNLPAWLVRPSESNLSTLKWYGKQQQLQRAIVGEAAYRQADAALGEYRRLEMEAALSRDPSKAMSYDDLANRSFFSSFERPIARRLQELVDGGQDEAAKQMFAREVANWSQFKYGRREQPGLVRGGFGRMMYTFGNFTGQFLEGAVSAVSNGTAYHRARYLGVVGAVTAGLYALENRTGWAFKRWTWPSALKYAGGPMAESVAQYIGAAGGAVALSDDRRPSPFQEEAMKAVAGQSLLPNPMTFFPYSGYLKSAAEYSAAAQGTNPLEQAARYTITGDKGSRVDMMRQSQDRVAELTRLIEERARQQHPGSGALP